MFEGRRGRAVTKGKATESCVLDGFQQWTRGGAPRSFDGAQQWTRASGPNWPNTSPPRARRGRPLPSLPPIETTKGTARRGNHWSPFSHSRTNHPPFCTTRWGGGRASTPSPLRDLSPRSSSCASCESISFPLQNPNAATRIMVATLSSTPSVTTNTGRPPASLASGAGN